MSNLPPLGTGIPFYVTRPYGDNKTQAQWTVNAYVATALIFLVTINAVLWSIYGIIQAVSHLI